MVILIKSRLSSKLGRAVFKTRSLGQIIEKKNTCMTRPPIVINFHTKPPLIERPKIPPNDRRHITKMAVILIYGITLQIPSSP